MATFEVFNLTFVFLNWCFCSQPIWTTSNVFSYYYGYLVNVDLPWRQHTTMSYETEMQCVVRKSLSHVSLFIRKSYSGSERTVPKVNEPNA